MAGAGLSRALSRVAACSDLAGMYRGTNVSVAVVVEVNKIREKTTKKECVILFSV